MPLSKEGKRILKSFKKYYGKRGESVFFMTMAKHPKETKKWHR